MVNLEDETSVVLVAEEPEAIPLFLSELDEDRDH